MPATRPVPSVRKNDLVTLIEGSYAWRKPTEAELQAWRDSEHSKGMTCAGETKLPPRQTHLRADGRTFRVRNGRVSAPYEYGRRSHCALIVDDQGVEYWAMKRSLLVIPQN